jgi:hypothetical protein
MNLAGWIAVIAFGVLVIGAIAIAEGLGNWPSNWHGDDK